ncbi:hypothetical protein B0I35DRAFT_509579 [Stachybotrys elegans]|uniref:BZIP domain-containing protein n=1 Tax=Stachybotrys elegans TaxID=80388 RepID=A0A8K0WUN6_9HYPO|nr:hypothetical protein B0I35DRAFT_509579 [Stachybotrys elegans]
MDGNQISKRRGRPRKSRAPDNPDQERRRSQLRKAQITFRTRKKETQKARDERLVNLETMVDQTGHAFLELADYIISSEVCREDSGILSKLAATTAQVLALSREGRDQEPTGEESLLEKDAQQKFPPSTTAFIGQSNTSSAETDPALHVDTVPSNPYWNDNDIPEEYYGVSTIQSPFGNGWFDRRPQLVSGHQPSNDSSLLDKTSFAFRLLNITLQTAYWNLVGATEDSAAMSDSIFRFAFLYHDKHELQFNLRWFLGPGIAESHLLMERNTAARPSIAKANGDLLNPDVDLAAVAQDSQTGLGYGFPGSNEPFATVKDVDEYLKERGARHVDSDIIELAFSLPRSPTTTFDASIPPAYSLGT